MQFRESPGVVVPRGLVELALVWAVHGLARCRSPIGVVERANLTAEVERRLY